MKNSSLLKTKMGPMLDLYLPPTEAQALVRWIEQVENFIESIPGSVQNMKKSKDFLLNSEGDSNEKVPNNSVFHTDGKR